MLASCMCKILIGNPINLVLKELIREEEEGTDVIQLFRIRSRKDSP